MKFRTTKPWYKRRRYWTLAFLAILFYFCFVPSPLKILPETTGITEPLLPNGEVDYFGAYEKLYIHKLSPPEDNGQRLLIAACGPRILDQQYLMDQISSWEELPTHERSKQWFHEKWVPLCEHMYIDQYAKPRFHDSLGFHEFLYQERKAKQEDASRWNKEDDELWDQLVAAPWTAEDHPDIARWLEERSPVLDLFGVAVRKPNFACYRWREKDTTAILLPDVQGNLDFARDLRVRIAKHLTNGDVDGAWYDVMSMFYLSRKHYVNDPFLVVALIGARIENLGWEAANLVLQYGKPSIEQLEQFAKDLDSLPRTMVFDTAFEKMQLFSLVVNEPEYKLATLGLDGSSTDINIQFPFLRYLPFDRNIVGKRITEFNNVERKISGDGTWNINWTVMKKHIEARDDFVRLKMWQLRNPLNWWRFLFIRTRSELIADDLILTYAPALQAAQYGLVRANAQFDLLRLAVALERYKSVNEAYPATLDELVPAFLEEVPLDAFTGRKTLTYKLAPDAETAYLLYSYGTNEVDDGGVKYNPYSSDIVLRMMRLPTY